MRGKNARTLAPGRRQVNMIETRKREHSRKPDEQYETHRGVLAGPFTWNSSPAASGGLEGWGAQANGDYEPTWVTYKSARPKVSLACSADVADLFL